jgi:L-methionine (R)-S-oxide reductase
MTVPVLDSGKVIASLRGAFAREVSREELLRTAAEKIRASGPPYTSVYLYMLHGQELVLEAHAGRETEHTRIPVGVGVCGTAVASGLDQNVPDVTAVGNYLACNVWTQSELVVLIRRGATILGQIDVDSDVANPFTPEEESAVKQVADALAILL